jgi:hypothetical protein
MCRLFEDSNGLLKGKIAPIYDQHRILEAKLAKTWRNLQYSLDVPLKDSMLDLRFSQYPMEAAEAILNALPIAERQGETGKEL